MQWLGETWQTPTSHSLPVCMMYIVNWWGAWERHHFSTVIPYIAKSTIVYGRKSLFLFVFLSGHSEVSQILHWLFSTIIVAPDNPFCCWCPTSVIITIIGLISWRLIPAYVSIIVSCLQVAYEDWFITLYNLCYSSLPVLLVGLLDQVKTSFVLDTKNSAEKGQWQVHYWLCIYNFCINLSPKYQHSSFFNSL